MAASNRLQDVMQVAARCFASSRPLTLRQSADRAHDSRQHELLSQLSHSIASISTSLADATALPSLPLSSPAIDVSQRVCELESEVATLKASLASQSLLGSLRTSIGTPQAVAAQLSESGALPELQVCSHIVAPRGLLCLL